MLGDRHLALRSLAASASSGIFVDAGYLFAAGGHLGRAGQFILTGSANPPDKLTRHSGAGRVLCVGMRPMSPFESLVVRDLRIYGQAAGCDLSLVSPP